MTHTITRPKLNCLITFVIALAALGLVVPSDVRAADVVKSATGTELTDGASWGGTAPGSGDAATWISTSLGAGLTLGAPSSWDGIGVSSALSDITISGASTLTLGSGDIDMSASTVNMTLNMPVELAAHQRWTVNAGKSLTLTNTISGASMSLAKAGSGTLNLLGTHTYSGTNTISAGSVYLGNSGTAASISSASPLHFTGSGLFAHYGRSGLVNSQVINGLFVSGGAAGIYTRNWGTSTTTDLRGPGGTLPVTRSIGTTVDFNKTDAAAYIRLVNGNDATGIIGAWATFGGSVDWAVNDGSDFVAAYTGYNTLSGNSLASGASVNYRVTTNTPTGNITLDTTGTIDVNTLRISDTAARTIDVRNGTTPGILRFGAIGGILTSGGRHAIGLPDPSTNGTITAGGADNTAGELIMNNSGSSDTDIRSDIADNGSGAVSLIKSGGGWLHLSGSNTYSGGTFVNGGGLRAWNANALGAPGSINVTVRSAQFNAGGAHNFLGNLTLDNSTFVCGVNGIPWGGPITLRSDSTINSDGYGATLPGNISGAGGFTKTGNQNLNLSGTNTYSGRTVVSTGTYLEFQKLVSAYNGDESKWTPANITVYTNTGLRVFVGGAGQFSIDQAGLLFTRLMSVDNNGLRAGSHIGITSTGGSYTLTNNLTDSIGPGGGKVGLYIGSLSNLELAGSNTFSGKVTMWAGTTLKVSSFNYVSSGSLSPNTSSSLGKPTTVEDGTIDIGGDWTDGGTLIYTGSGETTDRVLKLRAGHELYQFLLHQSGGGLLKFTSPFVYNQARGNVGIDIRPYGSTAGIGELAMSIPDNGTQVTEIRKYGTGVWILSGTNSYTGGTCRTLVVPA